VEERRRPAVQQTTRPVSFAAIIRSQQREQETQRVQAGKPLSCIQIEQQAINQLEALYNCHGNPDEYITVRRHRLSGHTPSLHHCPVSHAHSSTTSPWNMR
jgi:predicted SprT family Zn-dependent metalloprotease